ncbi:unnamed protein product [Toxocara canis]|uniref:Nucleolar complex protein 2 homolog n=1 Tax=Toxocara canis TaxID=6265 RepID=A0A183V0R2_TOXCA|nr:unnamed protein product [Toxocara canis]
MKDLQNEGITADFREKKVEEKEKPKSVQEDGEAPRKLAHKEELAAIAKNDPEFFEFLQQQDADLLQFNESDVNSMSGDEGRSESGVDVESGDEESTAGESSKVRADENGRRIIDGPAVNALREAFVVSDKTPSWTTRTAVKAFMACVARVGANIDPPDFAINDNKVFDEVVRLCFKHLGAALFEALGLAEEKSTVKGEKWDGEERCKIDKRTSPSRFKRWKKWSVVVKQYLQALLLFLNEVQNADVMVCTLRAVAQVVELYLHFSKLSRNLVKCFSIDNKGFMVLQSVVRIWSRKCLECRVSSMLVLSKIVRLDKHLYPVVLKSCYLGYVSNAREVTPESYPLISFMEKAFVEICHIYPSIAYPYAFVYIRQTAIHLRNAMIAKRKELIQTVYNWQFVQCLYLWAGVISKACRSDNEENIAIAELVYPLSQVTIATMRLFPSAKYLPLRMHCIKILMLLQVNCNVYIPTLSQAVQLLDDVGFILKKRPLRGKGTTKGIRMNCVLKASGSQLEDAGFRQALVEELFRVQLEAAYLLRSSCAFPDIVHPLDGQIKRFIKSCRNVDYMRLFKSLSSKLNEHAKWVDTIVATRQLQLNDQFCLVGFFFSLIVDKYAFFYTLSCLKAALEANLRSVESPLTKFYESWHNMWKMQQETVAQIDAVSKMMPKNKNGGNKVDERRPGREKHITKTNFDPELSSVKEERGENDSEVGLDRLEGRMAKEKKRTLETACKEGARKNITVAKEGAVDELVDFVMSDSE